MIYIYISDNTIRSSTESYHSSCHFRIDSQLQQTFPKHYQSYHMTDSNRNPSLSMPVRTALLSPSSPVTIWNRQVDLQHGYTPTCSPVEEDDNSGESTPVAPSPEDGDEEEEEEEEETPTVSLSWDAPWVSTTDTESNITWTARTTSQVLSPEVDTLADATDPSKCLPESCRRKHHNHKRPIEDICQENVVQGARRLLKANHHWSDASGQLLPFPRCHIKHNPLTTDFLQGHHGGRGNALCGGRATRSAPPTPATPNGGRSRLLPGLGKLDNHRVRGPPQAMPYLLSPLTPCSDPFLYLRVFEAVAKCTDNLEIR